MTAAATPRTARLDLVALAMGLAFAFMWSSAFTSARIIVAEAPPLLSLALRFALSGAIAIVVALALGQSWRLTAAQWRLTILFGFCQNALYLGLNFVAMQTVEASLAAIIASAMPLLVALFLFTGGEKPSALGLMGLVLGMAGVALIMGTRVGAGADPFGIALCVAGAVALAFATLALRGASSGGNVLMVVGIQMLVGAVSLAAAGLPTEEWDVVWSMRLTAAFAYTTLIPGLAATVVWFRLVRRIGATRAATFHFLNPVFGVAVAWALLGEAMGPLDLLGVAVVTAGILAVQLSKQG